MPRASYLWVAVLDHYQQRRSSCSGPEGDRGLAEIDRPNRRDGTTFNYSTLDQDARRSLVSRIFTSWNQMASWLSQLQGLQRAA